ncbi:Isobutyryl-CoA dehydrogenase, mitochondrial [Perkinsus chesapeaki]|uniref:Isobutyryl-CoA dehydrogenase, mitochondrial n=1 Tax=Perkinsus chesapeaki TaxID=330153 RepID=A0A7J6KVP4_PERCH|nr:Isobutyryl-CoA dehydrogenase, mitochondrial [Perkinsus chesapeaki]
MTQFEPFGDQTKFCEPAWYQGAFTPYYTASHVEFRGKVRKFMAEEVEPFAEEWLEKGEYPLMIHKKMYDLGLQQAVLRAPPALGGPPEGQYDVFHEIILFNEMHRHECYPRMISIDSMALPPLVKYGPAHLRDKIVPQVIRGEKHIALGITEPTAGSDVARIKMTAVKKGDKYIVNGEKKWITGGLIADYITLAVRTGSSGMNGLSLLLVDMKSPGISVRALPTMADTDLKSTFITFDDVEVPISNLIGVENGGFIPLVENFNHERLVVSVGAATGARRCYTLALKHAMKRKTFGKRLIDHQIIRYKLAEMARMVESLWAETEHVGLQFQKRVPDRQLGEECAILKVNASKAFEFCAREAVQIFGGLGVTREGQGRYVERLYRHVRLSAIPGGSEEILLDMTMRMVAAKARQ